IRDELNTPLPGRSVVIDFAPCNDIQISCDQLAGATGQTYVDPAKVVGVMDGLGSPTAAVNATDLQIVDEEISRGAATGLHYQRTDVNGDGTVTADDD